MFKFEKEKKTVFHRFRGKVVGEKVKLIGFSRRAFGRMAKGLFRKWLSYLPCAMIQRLKLLLRTFQYFLN